MSDEPPPTTAGGLIADYRGIAERLAELKTGPRTICATCGGNGCLPFGRGLGPGAWVCTVCQGVGTVRPART